MNHIANNRILNAMLLSPDLTISAVSNRQSELILLLNTINSRLSNAPDGTLRIAKRGNAHQYYHRTDSTDRTGRKLLEERKPTKLCQAVLSVGFSTADS